jgi:beta-aspartyl-peptidase (threonine type)
MKAQRGPSLVIHGGAGGAQEGADLVPRRAAMMRAAEKALSILRGGGGALDAVVAAVQVLEDNLLFNAGRGSALNAEGEVEMDAAVMIGGTLCRTVAKRLGGVTLVRRVRNPVLLARAVMEHSPHVLIGGGAAERFARQVGVALSAGISHQFSRSGTMERDDQTEAGKASRV